MTGRRSAAGFTLIELLVASSIFFVFTVGVLTVYVQSHATYLRGQSRIEARQNARVAIETIASELRGAGYDPSNVRPALAIHAPLQNATEDRLAFVADNDGDGTTELITFGLSGTSVVRTTAPWTGSEFGSVERGVLADGVTDLIFEYHAGGIDLGGEHGTVAASALGDVRSIGVTIVARNITARTNELFPLALEVMLRNAGEDE